jgi:hypothetical protein
MEGMGNAYNILDENSEGDKTVRIGWDGNVQLDLNYSNVEMWLFSEVAMDSVKM